MTEKLRIDRFSAGTARVGFLFNPLSGRIRKRRDVLRGMLDGIPGATRREVTNASEINGSIDAFIRDDTDLLVIVGGDGTVQGVLCHLFATQPLVNWPLLAIVPGGTTNMTALDLGHSGSPEQILQQLKDSLLKRALPALLQRHVLCIEQTGAAKVYGMFFGVGLIARAVIFSRSPIKRLGITGEIYSGIITLGYLAGVLLGFRSGAWAPVQMSIMEGDDERHQGSFAFLFASTLDRLLFGMRPYWGQEQEPLHITFVRQQRKHPLRSLMQLLSGGRDVLNDKNGYHSCNKRVLELLINDDYIVDGESYHAARERGPLRITAVGPVTFLAGSTNGARS